VLEVLGGAVGEQGVCSAAELVPAASGMGWSSAAAPLKLHSIAVVAASPAAADSLPLLLLLTAAISRAIIAAVFQQRLCKR
jgi:hypothetical protein